MLPSFVMKYKSSYEIRFHKTPNYTALRTFGCLCYISNLYSTPDKFTSRTLKCVFLGFPFNKKGYRVMDILTRKYYIYRDIIFVEDQFPFQHVSDSHCNNNSQNLPNVYIVTSS